MSGMKKFKTQNVSKRDKIIVLVNALNSVIALVIFFLCRPLNIYILLGFSVYWFVYFLISMFYVIFKYSK